MKKTVIIPGVYTLPAQYTPHAIPGTYPRRFWDVVTVEDEEELLAYLAGQQDFIPEEKPRRFEPAPFGQEARDIRRNPPHLCARCKRPCKIKYKYCYRCNCYLKVKERIA